MNTLELTEYLNKGTEGIIKRIRDGSFFGIKEALFLLRTKGALKRAAKKRSESGKNGLHIPAFLISSITQSCNLLCKGCYARANNICRERSGKEMLSAEEWGGIFRQAVSLGISFNLLAGGEPLMRRDVLLAAAKTKGMLFPVFTNGTLIDNKYLELFDRYRNLIPVISMEGGETATDGRRGGGPYQKLMRTFGDMKKKRLLYGVSLTVSKSNIDEITGREFIAFLDSLGCRIVFFIEYVPIDRDTACLAPDESDRLVIEQRQEALRKEYPGMLLLSFPGDEKHMGGCLAAGRGFFHIDSDGAAQPCPFSPYSACNVKDVGLQSALKSSFFEKIQEMNAAQTAHIGGCALFEQEEKVKELVRELAQD